VNLALAEGATWKDVQLMMAHWLRCGLPVSDEAMSKLVDCCIDDVRFWGKKIQSSFWDTPIKDEMLAPCVQLVTSTMSLGGRKPSARLLKETARKLIKLGDGASAVQLFSLIDKLYPDYNGLSDPASRRRAAPARAARGEAARGLTRTGSRAASGRALGGASDHGSRSRSALSEGLGLPGGAGRGQRRERKKGKEVAAGGLEWEPFPGSHPSPPAPPRPAARPAFLAPRGAGARSAGAAHRARTALLTKRVQSACGPAHIARPPRRMAPLKPESEAPEEREEPPAPFAAPDSDAISAWKSARLPSRGGPATLCARAACRRRLPRSAR